MREQQWISEVLHFCHGNPIILVGCKKDLRYDPKTIEELRKTSQKPVSPEEVRASQALSSSQTLHWSSFTLRPSPTAIKILTLSSTSG